MKAIDFLRQCGAFFVLTVKDGAPMGRPFGAAAEIDGEIYISTADFKGVYAQMKANPAVQITALRHGTREWLRMSARAEECTDSAVKRALLMECPALKERFADENAPHFAVFRLADRHAELYADAEKIILD